VGHHSDRAAHSQERDVRTWRTKPATLAHAAAHLFPRPAIHAIKEVEAPESRGLMLTFGMSLALNPHNELSGG